MIGLAIRCSWLEGTGTSVPGGSGPRGAAGACGTGRIGLRDGDQGSGAGRRCAGIVRSGRAAPGGGRVPRRRPVLPRDRGPRRAARDRVRAPRRARRRLPRLHRRQPLRRVAARGAPAAAARHRLRQPALGQPDLVGRDRARGAGARRRAALLQRRRGRVRLHLHPERDRRAAARRRGVSVRAARTASSPPSTTTTRSTASASSPARRERGPRTCRSRRPTCASPTGCSSATSTTGTADGHNLFAFPAQSNFSGVKHPLEWIAAAQAARLGRDRRLRRVRADQPARPVGLEAGLRPDLVLQDVRLPDRARRAARAAAGARAAAPPVVQRRHRRRREHPGRAGRAAVRPRAVRGRHRQLPRHPGGRDRPAPHRADRHRHDLRSASSASGRGCSRRCSGCATRDGSPATRVYGPADVGPPRRDDRVQLPAPGRPHGRRALRRRRRGRARRSRSAPAASATRARARPRSRSRRTR